MMTWAPCPHGVRTRGKNTSFRQVLSKEQIRRDEHEDHPKAIWVPANESGILPAKAFFALARLTSARTS